jgi:ACT domain-containing protein
VALSDSDIQRITEAVRSRLTENVDSAAIGQAIRAAAGASWAEGEQQKPDTKDAAAQTTPTEANASIDAALEKNGRDGNRIIVAAFGHNRPGVAAALTGVLAECNCDIADITQKILQEFFSMIMIVDISNASVDFASIRERLTEIESRLGVTVLAQHQDVYRAMHRI